MISLSNYGFCDTGFTRPPGPVDSFFLSSRLLIEICTSREIGNKDKIE